MPAELIFEADELPADLARVAAVLRIGEEAGDRSRSDGFEELGLLGIDLPGEGELRGGIEVRERLSSQAAGPGVEISQTLCEESPLIAGERAEP